MVQVFTLHTSQPLWCPAARTAPLTQGAQPTLFCKILWLLSVKRPVHGTPKRKPELGQSNLGNWKQQEEKETFANPNEYFNCQRKDDCFLRTGVWFCECFCDCLSFWNTCTCLHQKRKAVIFSTYVKHQGSIWKEGWKPFKSLYDLLWEEN